MLQLEDDDAWIGVRTGVTPGDVCIAPHPALAMDPVVLRPPDIVDDCVVTATIGYAVVIATYRDTASYVPIVTGELFSDPERLDRLSERARSALDLLRLPPLSHEWERAVVALLRMPQTAAAELIADKRVASMTDAGRWVLRRRYLRAWVQHA